MARTLYHNALIFTANGEDGEEWAQALVVDDARIAFAGSEADARAAAAGADAVDLGGRLVVPGFVDAHTHLLMTGEALG